MDYGLTLISEKVVDTGRGKRLLRKFEPTKAFWDAWRERKEA